MQSSWNHQLFYECTVDGDRTHGVRSKSSKTFYAILTLGLFIFASVTLVWLVWIGMTGSLKIGTLENGLFAIPVILTIVFLLFVAIPTVLLYSYKNAGLWYNRKYIKRRKGMRKNKQDLRTTLLSQYNLIRLQSDQLHQVETSLQRRLRDTQEQLNKVFGNTELFLAGSVAEKYCVPITQSGNKKGRISERIRHAILSDNDCMILPLEQVVSFQSGVGKYKVVTEAKHIKTELPYFLLQDEEEGNEVLSAIKLKEVIFKIAYGSKNESFVDKDSCCTYEKCCTYESCTEYVSMYQMCTCQRNFLTVDIKGPAIRYTLGSSPFVVNRFYCDLVFAFRCLEWPDHLTDWGTRQNQVWPSVEEIRNIKSQGCNFVPKSDPDDDMELTWRISFSNAEYELSKLIPPAARMCMIGMKIITKDYLTVVCRDLTSYHVKSIFLFMLQRYDPRTWSEQNLENCFRQFLGRVKECVSARSCPNYWIPSINMFKDFTVDDTKALTEQLDRIEGAPNKFMEPFDVDFSSWFGYHDGVRYNELFRKNNATVREDQERNVGFHNFVNESVL